MGLRVYNTLTRSLEDFRPLNEGRVGIYVCGPTVYDHAHIGHAKSYVSFDVIVRYLRYLGYQVRYVQNITDVGHLLDTGEDRILVGAARERVEPMELVEIYMRSYFEDMDALNVQRPNISPRASGHIPEQIELVMRLLERGYAYEVNGSVYFEVAKFKNYGELSGRRVEDQQAGYRVEINPEKRHPADFALWKRAEPEHIMRWRSPWGWGYPGWHTECSAMAMKYLGETLDIHGGGIENVFPHHECEKAQSEAATGKPFVRYWLHNNMVLVNGVKMSKSLGNFTTIKEALVRYRPEQIRFFILTSHYRSTVDFSEEALAGAGQALARLHGAYRKLLQRSRHAVDSPMSDSLRAVGEQAKRRFLAAMDDDFGTPQAIAALFDFSREVHVYLDGTDAPSREAVNFLLRIFEELAGQVLGILPFSQTETRDLAPFLDLIVEVRTQLRQSRQFALADRIRQRLAELGVVLRDTPTGTEWVME
ncbi:MAG: cysteine--tRNA ligase [candidate division KSB1 bacterium]|nr:cysteine--tRNA ligase [candidate division KSB1 bacterium]